MRTGAARSNRVQRKFSRRMAALGIVLAFVCGAAAAARPGEFDRTIREEIAKWDKLVKAAGITAE